MTNDETTTKTGGDVAHFYRALGRAGADGMPMPFQVNFYPDGVTVVLRYRSVEDVAAAAEFVGGVACYDTYTYDSPHEWHGYGTKYDAGRAGKLAGWPVEIWCTVGGPAPETAVES